MPGASAIKPSLPSKAGHTEGAVQPLVRGCQQVQGSSVTQGVSLPAGQECASFSSAGTKWSHHKNQGIVRELFLTAIICFLLSRLKIHKSGAQFCGVAAQNTKAGSGVGAKDHLPPNEAAMPIPRDRQQKAPLSTRVSLQVFNDCYPCPSSCWGPGNPVWAGRVRHERRTLYKATLLVISTF